MVTRSNPDIQPHDGRAASKVVCFGMITPARVVVVDVLPDWNTGAVWTEGTEYAVLDELSVHGANGVDA